MRQGVARCLWYVLDIATGARLGKRKALGQCRGLYNECMVNSRRAGRRRNMDHRYMTLQVGRRNGAFPFPLQYPVEFGY